MKVKLIGATAKYITKRVAWNGMVSSNPKNNDFIHVGKVEAVAVAALDEVYGQGLCHAALCSAKKGDWRCQCCDMRAHNMHRGLTSKAHTLPKVSGPDHAHSWNKVLRITDKIRQKRQRKK